jgi:hypothetical protein
MSDLGRTVVRHRRPSAVRRRTGGAVLVLAALAVGGLVNSRTPDTDHRERPFVATGAVGRSVDARAFDVTVQGVRGTMKLGRGANWHDTGGVWVLVRVRLVARVEPVLVGYAAVRDSAGRTYRATSRIEQPLDGRTLQPGVAVSAEVAFEVPPAVAPTLALRLAGPLLDQRMDAMAEVPLGITAAMVDGWLKDEKITRLDDAEVA